MSYQEVANSLGKNYPTPRVENARKNSGPM